MSARRVLTAVVVFDIDGTILDMRYLVQHVLLEFDRAHGTRHFYGLRIEDIRTQENQTELRNVRLHGNLVPRADSFRDVAWTRDEDWSSCPRRCVRSPSSASA